MLVGSIDDCLKTDVATAVNMPIGDADAVDADCSQVNPGS
jgi:hypothetical protein